MKLVKPSTEIISWEGKDPREVTEQIGRVCYKSEDKITADSAPKFVAKIISRGHVAVLDHWNVIFRIDDLTANRIEGFLSNPEWTTKYFRVTRVNGRNYASANVRTLLELMENGPQILVNTFFPPCNGMWPDIFQFQTTQVEQVGTSRHELVIIMSPDEIENMSPCEREIHETVSVRFVIDRGVSHELVRHRPVAYCQESTRYCNYGKTGQVTFVIPPWVNLPELVYGSQSHLQSIIGRDLFLDLTASESRWFWHMKECEAKYLELSAKGWSPQQARSVLPNSLKTEIVATANFRQWKHIFRLRCAKAAHPQMQEVMVPLRDAFQQQYFRITYFRITYFTTMEPL